MTSVKNKGGCTCACCQQQQLSPQTPAQARLTKTMESRMSQAWETLTSHRSQEISNTRSLSSGLVSLYCCAGFDFVLTCRVHMCELFCELSVCERGRGFRLNLPETFKHFLFWLFLVFTNCLQKSWVEFSGYSKLVGKDILGKGPLGIDGVFGPGVWC